MTVAAPPSMPDAALGLAEGLRGVASGLLGLFGASPAPVRAPGPSRPLRVRVVGGGPVGLTLGLTLDHLLGADAEVTVHDGRWVEDGGKVRWKRAAEGNDRREQVVTLQSGVTADLPPHVERAIFPEGGWSAVWPTGRNSPGSLGQPRNVRIRDVEDRLLEAAIGTRLRLVPGRHDCGPGNRLDCDVLAVCDGAKSPTREAWSGAFGRADPTPYSVGGEPLEDVILGLRVRTAMPSAHAVVMTVAQSRYLLNVHEGSGVLNMRLTPDEVGELRMADVMRRGATDCFRHRSCALVRLAYANGRHAYVCPTHGTAFGPAMDDGSPLWRRVLQGLSMFGVDPGDLTGLRAFRCSMTHRARFTAELVPAAPGRPSTFGFLLGDAANQIHFWPGRGFNHGLSSAVSLATCLKERWTGASIRSADVVMHEANMHMLQYRHKSRAWNAMARPDADGAPEPISHVIARSLDDHRPRAELVGEAMTRLRGVRDRLRGRLEGLPEDADLWPMVAAMEDEALRVVVGSGAWETVRSGGEEVDVTRLFRSTAPPVPVPTLADRLRHVVRRPARAYAGA